MLAVHWTKQYIIYYKQIYDTINNKYMYKRQIFDTILPQI